MWALNEIDLYLALPHRSVYSSKPTELVRPPRGFFKDDGLPTRAKETKLVEPPKDYFKDIPVEEKRNIEAQTPTKIEISKSREKQDPYGRDAVNSIRGLVETIVGYLRPVSSFFSIETRGNRDSPERLLPIPPSANPKYLQSLIREILRDFGVSAASAYRDPKLQEDIDIELRRRYWKRPISAHSQE